MLTFLIMAGGSGERFWPLSTKQKPKQLLKIFNDKSLIKLTYERILPLVDKDQIFIATNELQLKAMKEELPQIEDSRIIIEPAFRDTAAAIAYGSMMISKYYQNPTICVLASDHLIADEKEFRKIIQIAVLEAEQNKIVTLGIKPTYPETGYGYIQVKNDTLNQPTKSLGFKEKPELKLALKYFKSKEYLWNSGMFIFKYDTIMFAFEKYSINHYETICQISDIVTKNEGIKTAELVKDLFLKFEKKSIDYAVMEKASNIEVIPSSFGWNDVGNFTAFEQLFSKDDNNNIIRNINCISVDSSDNIIISDVPVQRVSLLGVHNMIVVVNQTEILICSKEKNQDIKKIIQKLA
ncbi:MAG: mannose-1-phosphate guanylyltransferase [Anaeroplasmataceae bacterium]|nr:mannose-1-phosphate guanylyltransferase [Anaeroplasmataceae bacterium]